MVLLDGLHLLQDQLRSQVWIIGFLETVGEQRTDDGKRRVQNNVGMYYILDMAACIEDIDGPGGFAKIAAADTTHDHRGHKQKSNYRKAKILQFV